MVPELELKPKLGAAMEMSVAKAGSMNLDLEDKLMPCVSNYKDNVFDVEAPMVGQTTASNIRENEDRTGFTSPNDVHIVEGECGDLTESSSSFGDTTSGTENGYMSDGDEVRSLLHGNEFAAFYDGYFGEFETRKKRLTTQWNNFVRPLVWRLKWLELKIKELQSQDGKYDSQLAKYAQIEQSDFDAMSAPKFMKRKKRKRVEDTTNIASYVSHHNLFSYESKRSRANGVFVEGDWRDPGDKTSTGNNEVETNDIWSSLEFGDGNSSLEDILWKIEVVHSKVWQLRTRVDKVVKDNPGNFSSADNFLVPCDASKGPAQNRACPRENGNRLLFESLSTASQHIKCDMGDLFLPGIAGSSHAELTPLPGMTGNMDQPLVGSVHENAKDIYLRPKDAVKAEPRDLEVKDPFIGKTHISLEDQKTSFPAPVSENVLPTSFPVQFSEKVMPTNSNVRNTTQEPDSSTRTALPWNTRNQGRRKPGSYLKTLNRKS